MRKLTKDEFITKSHTIHGNIYDYNYVEYINSSSKVDILCKMHGKFSQQPSRHMRGQGCPHCGIIKQTNNHTKTNDEFIYESKLKHGNQYCYNKTKYTGRFNKVIITCSIHGDFEQTPDTHLHSGCPKCAGRFLETHDIIEQFKKVHGEVYDYSLVYYEKATTKIEIICVIHGKFNQTPSMHKIGNGCPKCAKNKTMSAIYTNNPTLLYYIKINDVWKVGITKTSLKERYKKEIKSGMNIKIIREVLCQDGYKAFELEQIILNSTVEYIISKEDAPIEGGWTETRKIDVIEIFDKIVKDYNQVERK